MKSNVDDVSLGVRMCARVREWVCVCDSVRPCVRVLSFCKHIHGTIYIPNYGHTYYHLL